jgi:glycosyltransferase involved in cell wall biosynthesis
MIHLNKHGRYDFVSLAIRLRSLCRKLGPDILHTWMVDPNVAGSLLKSVLPVRSLVWDVRASNMDTAAYGWFPRLMFLASSRLVCAADVIVTNSEAGSRFHAARGYPTTKMRTISNGIDTSVFQPGDTATLRESWGAARDDLLVGLIARLDPMKDHPTFIRAAAIAARQQARFRFVLVGDGPEDYRAELAALAEKEGVTSQLLWAGTHDNMPAVHSALDISCSASAWGEGFSNSLAESMACGVPCVATDVGDARRMIEDCGWIVPPGEPSALAHALLEASGVGDQARKTMGARAMARIRDNFSVEAMLDSYEAAYADALSKRSPGH